MSTKDASACAEAVYTYLNQQNRPYSAIDIFNNLHKKYGKTLVVKTLENLVAEGKIRSKAYGKQTVFVADQSQFPEVNDSELKQMESGISALSDKLRTSTDVCRLREAELKGLNSALTTEQARKALNDITAECQTFNKRLTDLKSNAKSVSPEERLKILETRTKYVKEWRKRKRIANDILGAVLEGYPKSKKELYEEIGVETDEEYKVKPPDI